MGQARLMIGLLTATLLSCGGTGGRLEPRFVAVHNAMTAMGMAQTGSISEGSLSEGQEARIAMELTGGACYTFVALGDSQVQNINVRVVDADGDLVAEDVTHDRQAAIQACPDTSGTYQVAVSMAAGQGGYIVTSWSGSVRGQGPTVAVGGSGRGSCQDPLALEIGEPTHGDSRQGAANLNGSCVSGGAPEHVYRFEVRDRSQFQAVLQSTYDGALYLQSSCGQQYSEIACNDDDPDTSRSQVDATLEPGTYFLIVDGYSTEGGDYEIVATTQPLQPVEDICRNAPVLAVGQPVTGSTQGQANQFTATCAGGARSGDRVYRLDLGSRSRVRIRQQSDHDGVVYLRRSCTDATTEVACNDDFLDQRHSLVATLLDQGQYYVFTDGFSTGNAGVFTLNVELTGDSGTGVTGDACGDAGSFTPGTTFEADTFQARDDLTGTCGGQGSADLAYRFDVRSRSRIRTVFEDSEFTGALYLQRTCGDASSEVTCAAVMPGAQSGVVDTTLQPGTYFLVVDGSGPEAFGVAHLNVQLDDLAGLERSCRTAPMLQADRTTHGTTANTTDRFQATCAGGARSNDMLYRFRVQRRSTVRVRMSSDYDGALYIRRDCADQASEVICNDDDTDNRHAMVETELDPGNYFLIVDGFSSGNNGTFDINLEMTRL